MINLDKFQDKIQLKLTPWQMKVHECDERIKVLCCGIRAGKSVEGAVEALECLLSGKGKHIWIVAPTFDLTSIIFNYVVKFVGIGFPKLISGVKNRDKEIVVQWDSNPGNNGWIKCKSAESPEGLLGEELDLLVIDEASRIKKDIWESALYGRLITRRGRALIISTPKGKNWFWAEYEKAKDKNAAFHVESREGATFPPEEWELAKKRLPQRVFQQEYEAIFLDDGAGVFQGIDNIIGSQLEDAKPGRQYIMGVDLGKFNDFTVFTILDASTGNVVHFDRFNKIDYSFQKKRIISTAERYNNARIVLDSSGVGAPIYDDLYSYGLIVDDFNVDNFTITKKNKKDLIENLDILISQRKFKIPDIEVLVEELKSFTATINEVTRHTVYSSPEGGHDDCVMSLALALWGFKGRVYLPSSPIEKELMSQPARRRINSFE